MVYIFYMCLNHVLKNHRILAFPTYQHTMPVFEVCFYPPLVHRQNLGVALLSKASKKSGKCSWREGADRHPIHSLIHEGSSNHQKGP